MKLQHKITLLFFVFFLAVLLIFAGHEYVRYIEGRMYKEAKHSSDEQIIDKVLGFKADNYLQAVIDNGCWDEMVWYTQTKDSNWAILNFPTILESHNMTNLTAYSLDGKQLYNAKDSTESSVILSPAEVLNFFQSSKTPYRFYEKGDHIYEIFGATIVPVTDLERKGPAYGYLVCTKEWTNQYRSDLQKAIGFNLTIESHQLSPASDINSNDTIFRSVAGINDSTIARLAFYRTNVMSAELSNLQIFVISELILLIIIIIFISILTQKWITFPIRKIISSLSGNNIEKINGLANKKNEFGQIAKLIQLYNEQKIDLIKEIAERKAATLAVQEANKFSEMIYKVIPSALFTINNQKIITSWNKKAEVITGFTADEMIGKNISEFTQIPLEISADQSNHNMPTPIQGCEDVILHKSGKKISIIKNADILRDTNGNIIGEIESFEDISRRKNIEQKLRESQLRYATLVNKMPNIILIHRQGKIVYINDVAIQIIGYPKEELLGSDIFLYMTEESKLVAQEVLKKRAAGERSIKDYEIRLITKSGEVRDTIIKTELITYDNEEAVLSILIDITERKQFEKELIERELKLNTITRSAHDAIIMMDNDGLISFWNNAAINIFGYTEEEAIGKNLHRLIAPLRYLSAHTEAFAKFQKTGKGNAIGETMELAATRKDGSEIDVELSLSAIKLNDLWVSVGIVRDISERKLAEEALKTARDEAERANKAKSEFLAMMSHEIRTPMNAVIGMTELTLTTKLSKTQQEYLEAVQNSAYSLLDTINDILDFSKIEAGKFEIEHADFNLREIVGRCVEIISVKAFEKNVELLFEVDPTLPEIFVGDSMRIRQILVNLIGNAIKFTEKGEIYVNVKMNPRATAANGIIPVQFSVRDTGIGIPEEHLSKIFKSFEQADQSTTRRYGGTGLGLAISRKLTELMKGTIWVESKEKAGSTFYFEIPLEVSSNQELIEPDDISIIKNVLVIDDNETNLKIMHDMLDYWGITSTTISNGPEALELLKQAEIEKSRFDLVILDMHMPDMDGIMVADKIRNDLRLEQEPIILMFSSIEKDNLLNLGKNAGIDKFLNKPVRMNELHDILTSIVSKTGSKEKVREPDFETQEPAEDYSGKAILVAEDNLLNLKLMNTLLSKVGARVFNAANGAEAVRVFLSTRIDLILMDVHMPISDGFETTRVIRDIEGNARHTPIIALTAIAMQGDRERCIECGMDDYLSKPFKSSDLMTILKKYLSPAAKRAVPTGNENAVQSAEDLVFDKQALLDLTGKDIPLYNELLKLFTDLFPGLFENLINALNDGDYKQISYYSHTLKGMSGNIHANRISQLAKTIETMAQESKNISEIQPLTGQLKNEFDRFLKESSD